MGRRDEYCPVELPLEEALQKLLSYGAPEWAVMTGLEAYDE